MKRWMSGLFLVCLCAGSAVQAQDVVSAGGQQDSVDPALKYHDEMMALAKQRFAELTPEILARGGEVHNLLLAYQAGEANLSDILTALQESQQRIEQEVAPFQPWLESLGRGGLLFGLRGLPENGVSGSAPTAAGQSI